MTFQLGPTVLYKLDVRTLPSRECMNRTVLPVALWEIQELEPTSINLL